MEDPSQRSLEPLPTGAITGTAQVEAAPTPNPKASPVGQGPKLSRLSLGEPLGLLDGGATHALRPVKGQWEFEQSKPIKVGLASGETDTLRMNLDGTLVTLNQDTQPILPLGVAIRVLGMSVLWRENRCDVIHPVRVRIRVTLEKGCPEVPRALCLARIEELEKESQKSRGLSGELRSLEGPLCVSSAAMLDKALNDSDLYGSLKIWIRETYSEAPVDLSLRCVPHGPRPKGELSGFNRHTRRKVERGRTLLHLFSGTQAWSHSAFEYTLNVEKDRGWDLLDDAVYWYLFDSVLNGYVVAIVAGPPCRTWSRLRRLDDDGPPPLRSRDGPGRFGLEGLDEQCRNLVDGDTLLLLRTLVLMELMQAVRRSKGETPGFVFLEHPADPASYTKCCSLGTKGNSREADELVYRPPSIWSWPEVQRWLDRLGLHVARFDQGALGHPAVKPTQVATSSASLREFLNMRVVPLAELWHVDRGVTMKSRLQASKSHAAWAPRLVEELKLALTRWPG